ncbi:MAG: hypothetical protein H0T97_10080 [Actinobacteria bacterium]|nr:hypothetical protein [Actinomycetota bacterium]
MRQQRGQMPFSLLSVTSNPVGGRYSEVDRLTFARCGEDLFTGWGSDFAFEYLLDVSRQRNPT